MVPSEGGSAGGSSRRTTFQTDFHSAGSKTASQFRSGQPRPKRHTYKVRQAATKYTARQVSQRSISSNRRSSTRQPNFNTRKNTSITRMDSEEISSSMSLENNDKTC